MDKEEFVKELMPQCPEYLREFVPQFMDAFGALGPEHKYYRYQIRDFIPAIGRLFSNFGRLSPLGDKGKSKVEQTGLELAPEDWLISDFLADKIMPWVEDVRQELFDSRVAPFSTLEQVHRWSEDSRKKHDQWAPEIQKKYSQWLVKTDGEAQADIKTIRGYERKAPREKYPFVYYLIDKGLSHYTQYGICIFRADEIAYATGFEHFQVVMYILTNVKPVLPRFELHINEEVHRLASGQDLIYRPTTLEIRGQISFEELLSIYRDIRRELGVKKTKPFNRKHLQLYQLVKERGGPVRGKGSVVFWESVNRDWHNEGCATWKGARLAYDRLDKRLSNRYLTRGNKTKGGAA